MMRNYYTSFVCAATLGLSLLVTGVSAAPITGGTGPGGFDLTNGTTTLKSWLDASDASTRFTDAGVTLAANGDPVYLWKDKSGNNNNATATNTTTQRPSYNATALSGNSAIRFDPTGGVGVDADGMKLNPGLNITTQPFSVFILDQYYGATQGRTLQSSSGNNWLIGKWLGQNAFYATGFVASEGAGTNNPTIGVGRVGTAAGSSSYFVNGVDKTIDNTPNAAPGTLGLGAGGTFAGETSQADVSEIIVYTRQLNIAERRIVENYLSSKYNVGTTTVGVVNRTLGANDLYAGDLAGNGNYDYEVVGIGRSDASNQQLNSGGAGFGIEVTSGLSDGTWLLAGHDAAANNLINLDDNNPDTVVQRWDREWYVDKTGSLDATLAFDFEDSGLTAPLPGTTFQLLYSADSDFSDGFQTLATTNSITAGTVAFTLANALLLDGYYTLGLSSIVPEPNSMLIMLGVLGCGMVKRRKARAAAQQA